MEKYPLSEVSIKKFLEELGSIAPAPGGGAAAALSGAMAASLVEMVAGISARRAGEKARQKLSHIRGEAAGIRADLTGRIAEDAEAYAGVDMAMRLPRGTEGERAARRMALDQALREAAGVPLATATQAVRILELCEEALPLATKSIQSDVAVAAQLAHAAVHSALYNVDANALFIRDQKVLDVLGPRRTELSQRADELSARLLSELEGGLQAWLPQGEPRG